MSEWQFSDTKLTPGAGFRGGIVLKDVKHQDFSFANDIRVIGFWIGFEIQEYGKEKKEHKQFIPLTSEYFSCIKYEELKKDQPEKAAENTMQFSKYPFILGLRATFSLNKLLDEKNCRFTGLDVNETILFTSYGTDPAHEPSGGLNAARCFPIITFHWKKNENYKTELKKEGERSADIISIRTDYRMEFYLDAKADLNEFDPAKDQAEIDKIMREKLSQAGVFRDRDGEAVAHAAGPFFSIGAGSTATGAAFYAAEKPLALEIVADGLVKGSDIIKADVEFCWDNIHWWNYRGKTNFFHRMKRLPSAPGAFHAVHLHWRWGAAVEGAPKGKESQFLTAETLKDKLRPGILTHPDCFSQTIEFATVKYNKATDPNNETIDFKTLGAENFIEFFEKKDANGKKTLPAEIDNGARLVLWYSATIHNSFTHPDGRKITSGLNGPLFIQGIFFAHNEEPTNLMPGKTYVGERAELYRGRSKEEIIEDKKWKRNVPVTD